MTLRFNRIIIQDKIQKGGCDLNGKYTLKALRVMKGYTQEEASKLIGVSPETLSNYERGKSYPDVPIIKRIEKVYEVSYNDIIFLV